MKLKVKVLLHTLWKSCLDASGPLGLSRGEPGEAIVQDPPGLELQIAGSQGCTRGTCTSYCVTL